MIKIKSTFGHQLFRMNFNRLLIVVFFTALCLEATSRTPSDSIVKPPKTSYKYEEAFDKQSNVFLIPDSSLNTLQRYRDRYNLGNSGLAITNLYFPVPSTDLGFNYAANNFSAYTYQPRQMEYYNTHTPYTELFFLIGAKNELYSNFIHSQNINKNLNLTAKFMRIRSDGFYLRQSTNHTDFALSGNYTTTNKRYFLISNAIINSLKNSENGGIKNDSTFEDAPLQDRNLLNINLDSASRRYRSRSFFLKQYLNLGPARSISDTSKRTRVLPTSVLSHSFLIQDELFTYSDPGLEPGFYNNVYNGYLRTYDSTYIFRFENELSWRLLANKRDGSFRNLGIEAGVKQQYTRLAQLQGLDSNKLKTNEQIFNDFIAKAELYNYNISKFAYGIRGEYVFSGYNSGDNSLNLFFRFNLTDTSQSIGFTGSYTDRKPDFLYLNNYSTLYVWTNQFSNINAINANLYYRLSKYKLELGVSTFQYKNFVYLVQNQTADFSTSFVPEQQSSVIQGFAGQIQKAFYLGHVVFSNKIVYQYVPDGSSIQLPTWVTEQSLYYENRLFKKALALQIGFDVFYNSSYYANGYSPALGQFYVQNQKEIGNYPYVDVFLNLKISRARIFVKYENLNSWLGYTTYYYAPHYPFTDAAFKFGAVWRFFD